VRSLVFERVESDRGDKFCWSMPGMELRADVEITARRILRADQWLLFESRFLRGWTWREAIEGFNQARGRMGLPALCRYEYFRFSDSVETKLGRYWMRVGMFPTVDYFGRGGSAEASRCS
jgi:hypothetical protein